MDTNESGLALKHDIQTKYQLLKDSGMLTGSIEGNDISALVATHIRTGMSFAEAESTLRAAGLTVNSRPGIDNPRGRFDPYDVYASSLTLATGALTYPNIEVRITISPDNPQEYKFVHAVHGWIFVRGL